MDSEDNWSQYEYDSDYNYLQPTPQWGPTSLFQHQELQSQLVSINVTLFKDLGIEIPASQFRMRSEIMGDNSQEISSGCQAFEEASSLSSQSIVPQQQISFNGSFTITQSAIEESSEDFNDFEVSSPIFTVKEEEGLSKYQINRIPLMLWSELVNIINGGQKCSICLEDFKIGDQLRVMECLHRFHKQCTDQWLSCKSSCPNCRLQLS